MRKRYKRDRQKKKAVSLRTTKRRSSRLIPVAIVAIAVPLSLGGWLWSSKFAQVSPTAKRLTLGNGASASKAASEPTFQKLKGHWLRPDGNYVLAIKNVDAHGVIDGAYYNPRSIHIEKAAASHDADTIEVFFELRDVNYPGSNYTLAYDPASDQLKGIYYQAIEKRRFPVTFARLK